ncbi:hypothetical protein C8A01DRAFT_46441 [Parachaetomium inaequale]|uniref:Uncharacterized protein n=1 Tax=Parachaetomium inaequale TaxID=2588326 RepID=A0AAN6SRB1_9PEZI|nr:hypothetical protein C8A01DRAFT_46441 [Parachaetomium inaequale]
MVIYRAGGLDYTRRFDHTKVVDVIEYVDDVVYVIEITQGPCPLPLRLRVRQFEPRKTDKTHWSYNTVSKSQDSGAFCLADVEKTAKEFDQYIASNAVEGLAEVVKDRDPDDIATIKTEDGDGKQEAKKSPDQQDFLQKIDLGLSPGFGANHPHPGKILVSRMIVAQFDSIRHERIYKKLAPEVLRTIDTFLASCNKEARFTVFLATFLLLHQAARTSQDRHRHTQQNSGGKQLETRYGNLQDPLTSFVEEVHHSAVMLLAHWQYFKRCDLMSFKWDDIGESTLMFLEPDQIKLLKHIVGRLKEELPDIPATPAEGCWEHELFWVSKMFVSESSPKTDWTPPEMFTGAKPSVGRE